MKNIAILTGYYNPEFVGIAVHATELADELAQLGMKVTVFTGIPHYPDWCIWQGYRRGFFFYERQDGTEIYRNWLYVPDNSKPIRTLRRVLYEISFVFFQFLNLCIHLRLILLSDLIIVFSPPFFQGINSLLLARVLRKKIVFHVEDIQPDSAVDLGMLRQGGAKGLLISTLRWLEKKFYVNSYKVSTLTPGMRENILNKLPGKKTDVILFPYWVDLDIFRKDPTGRARFREKFRISDEDLIVGYAGNIGRKQKIEYLLDLATDHRINRRIKFLIAGDGAEKSRLLARKASESMENVQFMDLLQGQDYIDFLNGIDISYISQDEGADKIFIPSKLFKTLSCGSPILCIANQESELARTVKEARAGFVRGFDEMEETFQLLNRLMADKTELAYAASQSAEFARRQYDKKRILSDFLDAIKLT